MTPEQALAAWQSGAMGLAPAAAAAGMTRTAFVRDMAHLCPRMHEMRQRELKASRERDAARRDAVMAARRKARLERAKALGVKSGFKRAAARREEFSGSFTSDEAQAIEAFVAEHGVMRIAGPWPDTDRLFWRGGMKPHAASPKRGAKVGGEASREARREREGVL